MQNIFQITDSFHIQGRGVVATGKLVSGEIKIGMKTKIGESAQAVMGIESYGKNLIAINETGFEAGLLLSGSSKTKSSFWSFSRGSNFAKITPGEYVFEF